MRALIVDDSRFVRGFLRGLLEERGIECEEAGDGQAGMDQLNAGGPFDLALVDWKQAVRDVLPFLERPDEVQWLAREPMLKLLA